MAETDFSRARRAVTGNRYRSPSCHVLRTLHYRLLGVESEIDEGIAVSAPLRVLASPFPLWQTC